MAFPRKARKPKGNPRKPGKGEGNRQSEAHKPPTPKTARRKKR